MKRVLFLTIVLIMRSLSAPASAQVVFVDDSATGANDGSTWANAFNYLQDALEVAESGDEIRVAQGTYKPDQGDNVSTGDREAVFNMIGGVTLRGGYAGFGAPDPNLRDCEGCRTTLSGDIEGNDAEVAHPSDLLSEVTRNDNSYSILYVGSCIINHPPVVDGFTIIGASNRALNMNHSDIIVTDCLFQANTSEDSGGAVYFDNSRAIFTRCSFIDNAAGGSGGALYSDGCPTCRSMYAAFIDCIFTGNHAGEYGGAVCSKSTTLTTAINCLFIGNTALSFGAALYDSSYTYGYQPLGSHLVNCTFAGNNCVAVYVTQSSFAELTSCILWDNLCGTSGGINAQIFCQPPTKGTGSGSTKTASSVSVNYCCIEGWDGSLGGTGNFAGDPGFRTPGVWETAFDYIPGDYHLKSDSPCINAGDPDFVAGPTNPHIPSAYYFPGESNMDEYVLRTSEEDLDGEVRVLHDQVDMGPYESSSAPACIIYVDDSATGANNGSSWADAYNSLERALSKGSGTGGFEIRVAQGTYKPSCMNVKSCDPRASFKTGAVSLIIKGGYAGLREPDPDARDVHRYETILSGDLLGNDAEVADACDLLSEPTRADNSFCIIRLDTYGSETHIDGFTITGANAEVSGGGLFLRHCDAVVTDCTFINNSAHDHGGAMAFDNGRIMFIRCSFIRNAAGNRGGAIFMDGCGTCRSMYGAFIDCVFLDNYADDGSGGAIYSTSENMTTYINCLFAGNRAADGSGGALYDDTWIGSHFVNCTLYGNSHPVLFSYRTMTLRNCILWGNGPGADPQIVWDRNPPTINYCCIEGWDGSLGGTGNFSSDPCFASPGLRGSDGRFVPGDYHLRYDSPCIDAGDPNYIAAPTDISIPTGYYWPDEHDPDDYIAKSSRTDLDGAPRLKESGVDVGPYEGAAVPSIYVDDTATGANNGSSWTDAFNCLQDGLEAVPDGHEIWLAQGTYRPDQGDGVATGDRAATFQLRGSIVIRGGYAGFGAPDPDARNINEYPTILTGDLAGNDQTLADPADLLEHPSRSENSYHIVTISEDAHDVTLDGLTITGGNATEGDYPTGNGGGIYKSYPSSASLTNCTLIGNSANFQGGGMYNAGSLTMDKCRFIGNAAQSGGGMENNTSWDAPMTNCLFTGNYARSDGGAISTKCAAIRCRNCTFSLNRAEGDGFYRGGGITGDDDTDIWLTNCILWGNTDLDGAVESSQLSGGYNNAEIYYCCVQGWTGGFGGEGNFGDDPLFVNPDGEDNTAGTEDDNLRLLSGSPCINAGDPEYTPGPDETDLDGYPRFVDHAVDVGAYENQGDIPEDGVIYVDDDAAGANNGSSWTNAFNRLQDALAAASGEYEICVAQGTYTPDCGEAITPRDRAATFQLKNNVTIQGGYAGYGHPEPDARSVNEYETILSGDLARNDSPVHSLENWEENETRSDNSYHVVTALQTNSTAVLDGFTVSGGYADNTSPLFHGAGMYIYESSPTVTSCVFTGNWALNYGAGMCVDTNSAPIVTDCAFTANASTDGAGADNEHSNPTFIRCTFTANVAFEFNHDDYGGAGMYNYNSNPTLTNCIFAGNTAPGWGTCGGLQNNQSSPTLLNCTFYGNHSEAWQHGAGGIYNSYESFPKLTNCILWGNTNDGAHDESAQISGEPATPNYCCVQGWTGDLGGLGNIGADPCFVRPGYWEDDDSWVHGDYHLKSLGWRWDTVYEEWTFDRVTSRCIDAGNPGSPLLD